MDLAEWEEGTECAECGEPVERRADAGFPFGEELVLCFECATKRGGIFDTELDKWVAFPKLDGLV